MPILRSPKYLPKTRQPMTSSAPACIGTIQAGAPAALDAVVMWPSKYAFSTITTAPPPALAAVAGGMALSTVDFCRPPSINVSKPLSSSDQGAFSSFGSSPA